MTLENPKGVVGESIDAENVSHVIAVARCINVDPSLSEEVLSLAIIT